LRPHRTRAQLTTKETPQLPNTRADLRSVLIGVALAS